MMGSSNVDFPGNSSPTTNLTKCWKKNGIKLDINGKALKKKSDDAPVFLKKTFEMISSSNPDICHWSDDGKSFLIRNPDLLASKVIPQFFKHNNFSSFVRQLNFYGFRKVKAESIRIDPKLEEEEARYWRFRHEFFLQGRPDLLKEIKKANNTTPDQQEILYLKGEISTMKQSMGGMEIYINQLSSQISNLTSLINELVKKRKERPLNDEYDRDLKRRKSIEDLDEKIKSASDSDLLVEDVPDEIVSEMSSVTESKSTIWPNRSKKRAESFTSIASFGSEFEKSLFTDHLNTDEMAVLNSIVPDIDLSNEHKQISMEKNKNSAEAKNNEYNCGTGETLRVPQLDSCKMEDDKLESKSAEVSEKKAPLSKIEINNITSTGLTILEPTSVF